MADYLILKAVEFDKLSAKMKKTYGNVDELPRDRWDLQPKYDGCFGLATIWEVGPSTMKSRTGEDYSVSCRHILAELRDAVDGTRGQGWHCAVFLGEVWHPEWSFPVISGKFRKGAPCPELLFVANDMLPQGLVTTEPYAKRHADLLVHLPMYGKGDSGATFVVQDTHLDVRPTEQALLLQGRGGYDGAILRDMHAGYHIGTARNGEIVKVKPTLSLDLRCTGVTAGEGKHAGKIGALTVLYKGQYVGVGTGLSDKDREQPDDYWVGSIVEVECMGVSTEGKLREPRLKGIRIDKDTPDA